MLNERRAKREALELTDRRKERQANLVRPYNQLALEHKRSGHDFDFPIFGWFLELPTIKQMWYDDGSGVDAEELQKFQPAVEIKEWTKRMKMICYKAVTRGTGATKLPSDDEIDATLAFASSGFGCVECWDVMKWPEVLRHAPRDHEEVSKPILHADWKAAVEKMLVAAELPLTTTHSDLSTLPNVFRVESVQNQYTTDGCYRGVPYQLSLAWDRTVSCHRISRQSVADHLSVADGSGHHRSSASYAFG